MHESFRKHGLGKSLIKLAEKRATTNLLFATIRSENEASLALFSKSGFTKSIETPIEDHTIVLMVKNRTLTNDNEGKDK